MDRRSLSITTVSGFGALAGTALALELASRFGWNPLFSGGLGMLSGGCLSYLVHEFRQVRTGLVLAWQETSREIVAWRMPRQSIYSWASFAAITLAFNLITAEMVLVMVGLAIGFNLDQIRAAPLDRNLSLLLFSCLISNIFGLVWGRSSTKIPDYYRPKWRSKAKYYSFARRVVYYRQALRENLKILFWFSPFGIAWAPFYLVYQICRFVPRTIRALGRFGKLAFLYVHSDDRVACFTSASLGVAIGFFAFQNAILGGLAGMAFGYLSARISRKLGLVQAK